MGTGGTLVASGASCTVASARERLPRKTSLSGSHTRLGLTDAAAPMLARSKQGRSSSVALAKTTVASARIGGGGRVETDGCCCEAGGS